MTAISMAIHAPYVAFTAAFLRSPDLIARFHRPFLLSFGGGFGGLGGLLSTGSLGSSASEAQVALIYLSSLFARTRHWF